MQANFLARIIEGLNNVAKGSGVAITGDLAAPPPVNAITVKASGEQIHATLSHGAEVNRNINYFLEADTNPSFTQPHTMDLGVSRSHIFNLPTFDDNGVPNKWYLRTYCQYPGSPPSKPTVLGGLSNPTAITLHGLTKLSLLPPTGSGTASTTGQQGGAGRGKQRISTPKVVRLGKKQASNTPVKALQALPAQITTGSTPAVGIDAAPFSFTSTTTSITFTWASFNLYRNDMTVQALPPSPTGGIAITGLTANTAYYFYPYWDELAQQLSWATGGAGSPTYAFTAPSVTAAQVQNLVTNVPLSNGGIAITTPSSGSGGGSGGGGNCFTGETKVKTAWGFVPFSELPKAAVIVNETGTWWAELLVHEKCDEPVIALGTGRVNLDHGLRYGGRWMKAGDIFKRAPRSRFRGTLYNLHVRTEDEDNMHYIVEGGWVAHNFRPAK